MLGLGAAVGFLSGMFGVGGGFLLTPFLMLSGIPPAIAVATGANQIVGTSVSGTLAQWRRGNVDLHMGAVLIAGGVAGALDRRASSQISPRTWPSGAVYLADLRRLPRRDRCAHAVGKRERNPASASREKRLRAEVRSAQLDPWPAVQNAVSTIATVYQRHSPSRDWWRRRLARLIPWRRRRVHHGPCDDLHPADADQYRRWHVDLSDHLRDRRGDAAPCHAESHARYPCWPCCSLSAA